MRQSSTALNIKESRKIRDEEAEDHATIACDEIELALMLRLVFSLFMVYCEQEQENTSAQVHQFSSTWTLPALPGGMATKAMKLGVRVEVWRLSAPLNRKPLNC